MRLAPSSFHARFNEPLANLFRTLATEALALLEKQRPRLPSIFAPLREVAVALSHPSLGDVVAAFGTTDPGGS